MLEVAIYWYVLATLEKPQNNVFVFTVELDRTVAFSSPQLYFECLVFSCWWILCSMSLHLICTVVIFPVSKKTFHQIFPKNKKRQTSRGWRIVTACICALFSCREIYQLGRMRHVPENWHWRSQRSKRRTHIPDTQEVSSSAS